MRILLRYVILLALAGLVVAVTRAPARKKPCRRLCRDEIVSCIGTCRADVVACRQTMCGQLSGHAARACKRTCRRACGHDCRSSAVATCRANVDPTSCGQSTTTTPAGSTSTTTSPTSEIDWPTYGFDLQRTGRNPS